MIWKTHWNFLYEYTTNLNIISMINVNELCVAVTSRWKLLRKINIVCNSLRIVKLHFQECLDCKDAVRQYTFYTIKNIWYINLIFVLSLSIIRLLKISISWNWCIIKCFSDVLLFKYMTILCFEQLHKYLPKRAQTAVNRKSISFSNCICN